MDGSLKANLLLKNIPKNTELKVSLQPIGNDASYKSFSFPVVEASEETILESKWENIKPWNPEDPNLYDLKLSLIKGNKVLHEVTERIGFRSIDFRKKDGIYVNGKKLS